VPLGNDDTVKVETPAACGNDGDANNATPTTPLSATGVAVTGGPSNSQQQQQGGQPLMLFPQMQNMNANSPGGAGQAGGGNNMPMFFPPPGMFMNPRGFPMLGHPGGYSPYHPNMNMNAMSPLHAAVSAGISLALSCDVEQLSEYQIMVRQQLEIFQAGPEDVECNTQGRKSVWDKSVFAVGTAPVFLSECGDEERSIIQPSWTAFIKRRKIWRAVICVRRVSKFLCR
jgi:hypothetical protein